VQYEEKIGNGTNKFDRTVPGIFALKDDLMHLVVQVFLRRRRRQKIIKGILETDKKTVKNLVEIVMKNQAVYTPVYIQKTHQNTLSALTYMYKSKRWANASSY